MAICCDESGWLPRLRLKVWTWILGIDDAYVGKVLLLYVPVVDAAALDLFAFTYFFISLQ